MAKQMNKIAKSIDTVYIMDFNFINRLYSYMAIFRYAFLMNSKMYV